MGNSSSTNVFLSVDGSRTCITAGSTLTGEIRCPDHSISNDIFSGVTLYFIGKEDVEVRYTESGHGTKGGGPKSKFAKKDIIRTIIPLDTSNSSVESGRYPFRFRVPDQLPSSLFYKDGNGGYCSIRYKVKMHLMRGRDQEIPIEIIAKPPSVAIPSVADPMATKIQFLYCMPQGSVTWAVGADNTRIGVGENLSINLGIKNESLVRLERVTAKLKQSVEWHTSGHSSTNKAVVRSASFSKTDSMSPRSKDQLRRAKTRKASGPVSQAAPTTVYEEVLDAAMQGTNRVTLPIPEYICQSYTGRLIKVRHYVSIKAKTPSCFTDPKIHIPVEIVSPQDVPVVTAHVIPTPSAPPRPSESDEFFHTSDPNSNPPYLSSTSTFVVASPVMYGSEDGKSQAAAAGREDGYCAEATEVSSPPPVPPPFESSLIEPFLAREGSADGERKGVNVHL